MPTADVAASISSRTLPMYGWWDLAHDSRQDAALALRWTELDLDAGRIDVRHQFHQGGRRGPNRYLVFPNPWGLPRNGSRVTHAFQNRLVRAGLPRMRFHDLRHGAASLMLAQGASLREIMDVLGAPPSPLPPTSTRTSPPRRGAPSPTACRRRSAADWCQLLVSQTCTRAEERAGTVQS